MTVRSGDWGPERALSRPHPAVRFAAFGGEGVVYDPRTALAHRLDPLATAVWRCLDGEGTLADLAGDIADGFDIPADGVEADVGALLARLDTAGLLEGSDPPHRRPAETDVGEAPRVFHPRPHG